MFDRKNELELLQETVMRLREYAPRCPEDVRTGMRRLANELKDKAVHVERLLIRQRAIRPKTV